MRHGSFPFQGNEPLNGAALYRALGRDDLARAYETRVDIKIAFGLAAVGAFVAGTLVLKSATPDTQCELPPRNSLQPPVCQTDWNTGTVATGIVLLALSPILGIAAGVAIDADPVAPAERRKLIDAFNASLAHATTGGAPARPRPAGVSFTASPTLSSSGAGLTVDARF